MSVETLASDIFREFKTKPESQHIATEFAMVELSRLVARVKPRSVLEVGAGIGTITKLLLTHPDRPKHLTVTEGHPVCLAELAKNLEGVELSGYTLVKSAIELNMAEHFDLVIFDGTLDDERQYAVFRSGTWCFVEGSRSKTIEELKQKLAKRGLGIAIENKRPGGRKVKLLSARRFLGLPLPAFKFKPLKGCSLGQVVEA
jgi:SAM-dependent methyltransferase